MYTLDERLNMMSDKDIVEFAEDKDQEFFEKLEDVAKGLSNGVIGIGPSGIGKTYDGEHV